jgi:hypothetical protein
MATFHFEHRPADLPDRAFVEVDGTYNVAIIRTDEGLIVDVWPKDWDSPIATLGVCDNDMAEPQEHEQPAHAPHGPTGH